MDSTFSRKTTQDNFVTEKVDIFKNNLLGEYDDNGNYSIAPQIVQELIELKKFRKKTFDNSVFCYGNLLGYGEIAFEISFDKSRDDENRATASLFVLEDVDKVNGYLQNIIKTKLADFVSNVSDFIEQAYVKFNMVDEEDDDEGRERKNLDDLELDDSYILAKRAYMLLLDKLSDEKMLDAYGKYFTARLTVLTKLDNEFSTAVLDLFNQKYELIEDIFLKEKNYKALNELLDSCIESISGTKEIYLAQEGNFNDIIKDSLTEFTESVNRLSDKAEMKAINLLDPEDRNKMNQMNATFENLSSSHEVKFEQIEDEKIDEQEIDESFNSPVIDAVEEIKTQEIEEDNQLTEDKETSDEEIKEKENEEKNMDENTDEKSQDDVIRRILSMQEEQSQSGDEMSENLDVSKEDKNDQNTEEIANVEDEKYVNEDISEEFISSKADFHKNRQNDRLNNISDRLIKLSEITSNTEENRIEEKENIEEENSNFNDFNEQKNELDENRENFESKTLSKNLDERELNKDRFSALFDYLEKKQDSEDENQGKTDFSKDDFTL